MRNRQACFKIRHRDFLEGGIASCAFGAAEGLLIFGLSARRRSAPDPTLMAASAIHGQASTT